MTSNNVTNTPFPISIVNGGTGSTGATAAFNALSPLTTKGDIIVFNGTNNIRVAVGSDGNILTSSSGAASGVVYAATTTNPTILSSSTVITASQVLALRATPITVLSAQGAGVYVVPLIVILKLTYGGNNAFTNPQTLAIKYTNAAGPQASSNITGTGFIDQSANKYQLAELNSGNVMPISSAENSQLVINNIGASEITGNASLDNSLTVVVLYKTVSL